MFKLSLQKKYSDAYTGPKKKNPKKQTPSDKWVNATEFHEPSELDPSIDSRQYF